MKQHITKPTTNCTQVNKHTASKYCMHIPSIGLRHQPQAVTRTSGIDTYIFLFQHFVYPFFIHHHPIYIPNVHSIKHE
jgi:hypothetical protein